jgi:putative SOS response-associated peptidase YedK
MLTKVMCGRVDIHTPPSELARLLEAAMSLGVDPEGRPSWNVPPTRGVPVIVADAPSETTSEGPETAGELPDLEEREHVKAESGDGKTSKGKTAGAEPGKSEAGRDREPVSSEELRRRLDIYRWGLLPHWAKDTRVGYKMINAKAETLTKSSAYRTPFRKHRCLIVVDGFYEWRSNPDEPKKKTPFYFRRADGQPITFAGLYDTWWDKSRSERPDPETLLRTCTIVTTSAGPDMIDVHNRMPVIIERSDIDSWIDPAQHDTDALSQLLGPSPKGTLSKYEISREVNSPRNDGPQIIEPVKEDAGG